MLNTDTGKYLILRIKVFQCTLYRNIAKFGKMNPFVEISWNDEIWKTQTISGGHVSAAWNESHVFESSDASPLSLKVTHSSLLFIQQLIGETVISTDDLFAGKNKNWLDLYFEGNTVGKILISAYMYEERRSEQSTYATSYLSINIKEEACRKQNELELEKEELEYYKRKYKRKLEKLNQEKRNYQKKVNEIILKTTPRHTEETSSDEIFEYSPAIKITFAEDRTENHCVGLAEVFNMKDFSESYFSAQKTMRISGQLGGFYSQEKVQKGFENREREMGKEKGKTEWEDLESVKKDILKECFDKEETELKLDFTRGLYSPKRAKTPKSCDAGRFDLKLKQDCFLTSKFVTKTKVII